MSRVGASRVHSARGPNKSCQQGAPTIQYAVTLPLVFARSPERGSYPTKHDFWKRFCSGGGGKRIKLATIDAPRLTAGAAKATGTLGVSRDRPQCGQPRRKLLRSPNPRKTSPNPPIPQHSQAWVKTPDAVKRTSVLDYIFTPRMAEDVETVIAQGTFFVVRPSQGLGKMSIFTKRETITLKKAASKVAQCTAPPQLPFWSGAIERASCWRYNQYFWLVKFRSPLALATRSPEGGGRPSEEGRRMDFGRYVVFLAAHKFGARDGGGGG